MKSALNRRCFLRSTSMLGAGIGLAGLGDSSVLAAAMANEACHAEKLGWRLGVQAWSFHTETFSEAVDKTASLGLRYIEAIPAQKLSPDQPEMKVNEYSSAETRKAIKQKLADAGVKLVNYGVCGLPKDADQSRRMFDFAKEMGIETIVSEPAEDAFDTIEKLCDEYEINVAIHNHPKPSHYWNPDTVLEGLQGPQQADRGVLRHGPLAAFRAELDRVPEEIGRPDHQLPFQRPEQAEPCRARRALGHGACDVKGMLAEVQRQGVKAVFSIEYEYHWGHSLPEIAQCVKYFDKTAAQLSAQA